jgi:hypothetical protein
VSEPGERSGALGPRERASRGVRGAKPLEKTRLSRDGSTRDGREARDAREGPFWRFFVAIASFALIVNTVVVRRNIL